MQGFESNQTTGILPNHPLPSALRARVRNMRRTVSALMCTILFAAGCGGSDSGGEATPAAPASTETAVARSLHDTCPLLEQAMPTGLMPSTPRLATFSARLDELADQGDVETQNAVAVMQSAVDDLREAGPGSEYASAFAGMTDAIETIADRCAAVGSSAFQ